MQTYLGEFQSSHWGRVTVWKAHYERANGPLAITLEVAGEPLGVLSVNMYKPACSQDSKDLPPGCFYVKTWSENEELAEEALASGLFKVREDLPAARSGFVSAPVWEVAP